MRALLTEAGALVIEVPNCQDPYWQYRYYPDPPHVQFFTPESLKLVLEQHGFAEIEVTTCGRPIESERDVGYLHPDTPEYLPRAERARLLEERAQKAGRAPHGAPPEVPYMEHGREFIRAAATVAATDHASHPAPVGSA